MSELAISARNLSKVYKLYNDPIDRVKESLNFWGRKYHEDFYALKNVSLELKRGEVLGILGKNGAGKSTLLKILVGVLTPTTGEYQIRGKVASLLELGSGFNPELSGLENVHFYGTILGYSKEEMKTKIKHILEFADIGDFVNRPVRTYSSGMQMRLAFAVAVNLDPDVFIIDEALSVGDIRFKMKCFRRLDEFKKQGGSIVFVTHDVGSVVNFCDSAIWLDAGEIREVGEPEEVVKKYSAYMAFDAKVVSSEGSEKIGERLPKGIKPGWCSLNFNLPKGYSCFGEGGAEIQGVFMSLSGHDQQITMLKGGENVSLFVKVKFKQQIKDPIVGFVVNDKYGNKIFGTNTNFSGKALQSVGAGISVIVKFDFKFPHILNGEYTLSPAIAEGTLKDHVQHHFIHDAYVFRVNSDHSGAKAGWYLLLQDCTFEVDKIDI